MSLVCHFPFRGSTFVLCMMSVALLSTTACDSDETSSQELDVMPVSDQSIDPEQGDSEIGDEVGGEMLSGQEMGGDESGGDESGRVELAGEIAGSESMSGDEVTPNSAGSEQNLVEPILKSEKRGIAYNVTSLADLEALSPGVSWWYNWSPRYDQAVAQDYQRLQVDWVPMTWNGNNPDEIRAFLDNHPEVRYLLTYNEPNFQDQANMTPAYAASLWPTFEQIAEEYDLELVGPALNYCGNCVVVNGAPIGSNFTLWMDMFFDEFRAQFDREPHMDYTALHWYDYGLEDQVDEMVMRYNKPVWLTEFALWRYEDWATDELERQWLIDMVAFLEAHPYVHRYAWFTGRRPDFPKINLLAEDGVLTPLGEAYVNAPYYQP